jgi:neutral ceramidase
LILEAENKAKEESQIKLQKNSEEVEDIIKLEDNNGNIKGLLYNYACHPTSMGPNNYLISADYPGVVRKILEEQNPGMTAMFLQGCGADIKPVATTEDGAFKQCTFEELEVAGASLAEEIQNLLKLEEGKDVSSSWRKINADFQTKSSDLKLYSESWDIEEWIEIEEDPKKPEYIRKAASRMVSKMKADKVNNYIPYYISYLRLDDKTSIIALENEVVSDIGKDIKKVFHDDDVITLGYSNSVMCYIPTKKVLAEGGYESTSFISAGLPGQFVDEVEDIIIGRIGMMVKG